MSDDEDLIYIKKQKTIHYGSLEEQERMRQAAAASKATENLEDTDMVVSVPSPQVHTSNGII